MDIEKELNELLCQRASAPFLFLGSGFSRRYIGLENWEDLFAKFCSTERPYAFYKTSANNDIPASARIISDDFHNHWWTDPQFKESREAFADQLIDRTSPLRLEICKYLSGISKAPKEEYKEELRLLSQCDVDGIITTNWDCFLEDLFPDYKTYVGQKELLFSNPLSIAEIYKIHGCCSKPESLVLTDHDYRDYKDRNAYLASKLITIFVEHPVVFIGYSLMDSNIRDLLKSISMCIGPENVVKLQNNLIFVDRKEPASGPTIETTYLQFDTVQIPVRVVKTKDFCPVYSAIGAFERKLPARVLRFCKERIFEIVKSHAPERKIGVVDFESIDDPDSVEIVIGLGVLDKFGEQGYRAITTDDLFEDLILDNKKYHPKKLIDITITNLPPRTKFIPIFKYLRGAGIKSLDDYKVAGLALDRFVARNAADFARAGAVLGGKYKKATTQEFLAQATEAEIVSTFVLLENIDLDIFENYLVENFADMNASRYKYHYRKLIAFYDWLKYGFH